MGWEHTALRVRMGRGYRERGYWTKEKEALGKFFRDYKFVESGQKAMSESEREAMLSRLEIVVIPTLKDALYCGKFETKRNFLRAYESANRLRFLLDGVIEGGALDLIESQKAELERDRLTAETGSLEYLGRVTEDFQRC